MRDNIFKDNWEKLRGEIRRKWAKLTDEDLTSIEGDREKFLGKVQSRYSIDRSEADKQLKEIEDKTTSRAA